MTSPNNPQSPKEDTSWLHEEPTSIGERPPGLPPAPPPPPARAALPEVPKPAAPKPDASANKVRGVFGKHSLPPPPAGRGPVAVPRPLDAKPELPTPPTLGAPELPSGISTMDDPLGDLFADGAVATEPETIVMEADAPTALPERDDPTLVPSGNEGLFADLEPAQVARVGLAKTMLATTAAEEIMAHEPTRDPRSEDSIHPDRMRPSNLEGVVFDPDQSVARHLGEAAIDGQVGPAAVSDALADLPLPQVEPAGLSSDAPIDAVPVRSMRSAMMIMALVLISGGAATLMSLGVLGSSPAEFRKKGSSAKTASQAAAPIAAPKPVVAEPVEPPSVATAPRTTTPTIVAEPEPTPAEVAPAEPAAAEAAAMPAAEAPTPEPAPTEPTEATPAPTPTAAPGDAIETGDSLLRTGETDAALAQYQAALNADPRDHHAMEGLVKIHLARNQYREALGYAEQIVKRRPKRAAYRILQGQALLGTGDRAGARQAFQEALALEPDNREAQRLLGP